MKTINAQQRVMLIISLFLGISLLLLGMLYLQANVLDGVRAYVRGEGLWAKGQKDAVLYLNRYSYSALDTDFRSYQAALEVSRGDRQARLAMLQEEPDLQQAQAGFIQGQNDPRDVELMIWFFLNFHDFSPMSQAIVVWEEGDRKITELNQLAEEIRHEIEQGGRHETTLYSLRKQLDRLSEQLLQLENRFSMVLADGARVVRLATWVLSLLLMCGFSLLAVMVSIEVIKGINRAEKKLLASELRFRSLSDSNIIGIFSWHLDGRIDDANDYFLHMLGIHRSEMSSMGIDWRTLSPPSELDSDQHALQQLEATGYCLPFARNFIHADGHLVPVFMGGALLHAENKRGIAFVFDQSKQVETEKQLHLAATVFNVSNDGIMITDPFMNIVSVNTAFCKMTDYDEQELLGKTPRLLQSGHTTDEQYRQMWQSLEHNGSWQGEVFDRRKDGELLPIRFSISAVKDNKGRVTHYAAIVSDISLRRAEEEQLRKIAFYDPLTGLPNRVLLNDRIEQCLRHVQRSRSMFALLFVDLDRFKVVNDTYGHVVGDKLLQCVAQRLLQSVRATDTISRLGGDEFIILLEEVSDREMVSQVVDKIVHNVAAVCEIEGRAIEVGISVGVSLCPEHGTDMESLLHHADVQMYQAKCSGRQGARPVG